MLLQSPAQILQFFAPQTTQNIGAEPQYRVVQLVVVFHLPDRGVETHRGGLWLLLGNRVVGGAQGGVSVPHLDTGTIATATRKTLLFLPQLLGDHVQHLQGPSGPLGKVMEHLLLASDLDLGVTPVAEFGIGGQIKQHFQILLQRGGVPTKMLVASVQEQPHGLALVAERNGVPDVPTRAVVGGADRGRTARQDDDCRLLLLLLCVRR